MDAKGYLEESDGGRNVEDCVRRARRKFLTKVMKDGNGKVERGDCGEEKGRWNDE